MKTIFKIALVFSLLMLTACQITIPQQKEPTPFVVGETRVIVTGCEELKAEVERWNKNNPGKIEQKADC